VKLESIETATDREHFIDLLALDVNERMRVAGAVANLGPAAAPAVESLLTSDDVDAEKLAVAILNEGALPLAARFAKSSNCELRQLGITIFVDMWPVLPTEHVVNLKLISACEVTVRAGQ
jgi:hypothetical protein